MKTTFLPILKDNNNNDVKILSCSTCEADDIIGHLSLYIQHLNTATRTTIYILANDNDYLQVCNKNITLINGVGKIISGIKGGYNLGDNYLLSKILLGDKSDNIKCCSVNIGYICSVLPNTNFIIAKDNLFIYLFSRYLPLVVKKREMIYPSTTNFFNHIIYHLFSNIYLCILFHTLKAWCRINLTNCITSIIK